MHPENFDVLLLAFVTFVQVHLKVYGISKIVTQVSEISIFLFPKHAVLQLVSSIHKPRDESFGYF